MDWEKLLLSAFPLGFAIFWLGLLHAIAWMGGWTKLARQFPDDAERHGHFHDENPKQRRWFQSGSFGLMNYNSALNIGVYEAGIRVAVLWPFRPGHPPLFIPWSELRDGQLRRVFPFVLRLIVQVGQPPVRVLLPVWVKDEAEKMLNVAGNPSANHESAYSKASQ